MKDINENDSMFLEVINMPSFMENKNNKLYVDMSLVK